MGKKEIKIYQLDFGLTDNHQQIVNRKNHMTHVLEIGKESQTISNIPTFHLRSPQKQPHQHPNPKSQRQCIP